MSGSGLTLEALAADIQARSEAGDRDRKRSDDHYKAAGIHLVEARERVKKLKLPWAPWVRDNLTKIGISRSYELLAIGEGRKTQDEINQEKNAGQAEKQAVRRAKRAESPLTSGQSANPIRATLREEWMKLFAALTDDQLEAEINLIKEKYRG